MNHNSIRYLKAVGAVIVITVLLANLYACAAVQTQAPGTSDISAAPAETGTPSPSEVSPSTSAPSGPFSDVQIKDVYAANGLAVMEIRDAGNYTLVHYYSLEEPNDKVSRFDWFDRKTGEREFVDGGVYTDMFEITADKKLTVLTTGLPPFDGYQQFPRILIYSYTDVDGAFSFTSFDSDYYMPLERSFSLGIDRPECLKSVCYDGSSMLLTFDEQPGYEQEFHTGEEAVPKMTVTNKEGISTVIISNTILSDDFIQIAGALLGSDPSPVTVTCDGKDTVVTFKMSENARRYNISCFTTPVERVPHAVITYEADRFGYPKEW